MPPSDPGERGRPGHGAGARGRGLRPGLGIVAHGQQAPCAHGVGGPHRTERRRLPVATPPTGDIQCPTGRGGRPARGHGAGDSPVDPRIMAALLRLPARQRQVIALRLFLDLDTVRTAEVLGFAPARSQMIWPAPSPRCATTSSPSYSRRPHHERRRLIVAVGETFASVHLDTPAEQICAQPRHTRPPPDSRVAGAAARGRDGGGRDHALPAGHPPGPAAGWPPGR